MRAHSTHGDGAQSFAHSSDRNGLVGLNDAKGAAPHGGAPAGNGVFGYSDVPNASGVVGAVAANNVGGAGVTGIGPVAGRFVGDVVVTGDVQLTGADVAEEFDVIGEHYPDPGSVVVLTGDDQVRVSDTAYDHRVAGVVSGAGNYKPALVLDRREPSDGRRPLAMTGKVYCKVDAALAPIAVGDLLTTSETPGHAMKATDLSRAFGSIIGKALMSLQGGRGLVPILVALQ